MTKLLFIHQDLVDKCEDLIGRVNGSPEKELFTDLLAHRHYDDVLAALRCALSDTTEEGFPCGKRGLPTERLAAETVIARIEASRAPRRR